MTRTAGEGDHCSPRRSLALLSAISCSRLDLILHDSVSNFVGSSLPGNCMGKPLSEELAISCNVRSFDDSNACNNAMLCGAKLVIQDQEACTG